jgi:hypothetical protein
MGTSRRFGLVRGGRARTWRRGRLEVVAATPDRPPFPVARRVLEEDRWRVLGASPEWRPPPPEHPVRLHTALLDDRAADLGTLLGRGSCWHAVVVDLDAERLVVPEVVASAWESIAARCARARIRSIAVPLLGTVHGDLAPDVALRLLSEGLLAEAPAVLQRVWLQVPLRHQRVVEQALAAWRTAQG